jgi:hypothetical protein
MRLKMAKDQMESVWDLVKEEWPGVRDQFKDTFKPLVDYIKNTPSGDTSRETKSEQKSGFYRLETWEYHGRNQFPNWSEVAKSVNKEDLLAYGAGGEEPARIYDPDNNLIFETGISKEKRSM